MIETCVLIVHLWIFLCTIIYIHTCCSSKKVEKPESSSNPKKEGSPKFAAPSPLTIYIHQSFGSNTKNEKQEPLNDSKKDVSASAKVARPPPKSAAAAKPPTEQKPPKLETGEDDFGYELYDFTEELK